MTKCYQCDEMLTLESDVGGARCTDCLRLNQQVNEAENINLRDELAEVKRALVHFRAKAKRLDRENVNQSINLQNYRKYLGFVQDAITDLQEDIT
jgi:hypothetical protein